MLWPKINSYKEFDKEKNSRGSKIPLHPHNFSNGPSLIKDLSEISRGEGEWKPREGHNFLRLQRRQES